MASSATNTASSIAQQPGSALADAIANNMLPQDSNVEADDDEDSSYGNSLDSDTTTLSSAIWRGHMENGRKYSNLADKQYYMPADERQMDSWNAGHITLLILDSQEENPLFRSPISRGAQNILDIGTGDGSWAVNVADMLPHVSVTGVDLYPPPGNFVPPNLVYELDDLSKEWTFSQKFDLIHLRWMLGSFTTQQWTDLYAQAYDALVPGGWIEQIEPEILNHCDDGSVDPNCAFAQWGNRFLRIGEKIGRPFDVIHTMRSSIEAAGFVNVHEKMYKTPIGGWPKHPLYKEAGKMNEEQFRSGMEGYAMHMLTNIGDPEPESVESVQMYLAEVRKDMEKKGSHPYIFNRRVWAQKPMTPKA